MRVDKDKITRRTFLRRTSLVAAGALAAIDFFDCCHGLDTSVLGA
jgi:hypothetical protein